MMENELMWMDRVTLKGGRGVRWSVDGINPDTGTIYLSRGVDNSRGDRTTIVRRIVHMRDSHRITVTARWNFDLRKLEKVGAKCES
jgi:hypothetical protein